MSFVNTCNMMDGAKKLVAGIAAACILSLTACGVEDRALYLPAESGTQGTTAEGPDGADSGEVAETPAADVENISYELPAGWRWLNAGELDAVRGPDYEIGEQLDGKIVFDGVWEGDRESARAYITDKYNAYSQDCAQAGDQCGKQPEYAEIDAAGTTVFCALDANGFAGLWISYCGFAKDGRTVRFTIYGRAEKEKDLLEKIAETVTWE